MGMTLNESIEDCFFVGQEVSVSLYNKARLIMVARGELKQEKPHGQFYIKDNDYGVFFIFTDNGYDLFYVHRLTQNIQLYID